MKTATQEQRDQYRELEKLASQNYAATLKAEKAHGAGEISAQAFAEAVSNWKVTSEAVEEYGKLIGFENPAKGIRDGRMPVPGAGYPGRSGPSASDVFVDYLVANPDAASAPSGAKRVPSMIDLVLSRPVSNGYRAALDGGNLGLRVLGDEGSINALPRRRLSILDLIPSTTVAGLGGEKLQYFKHTARTNNASTVALLGEKPTSVVTVSREETSLWTYAHLSEEVALQLIGGWASRSMGGPSLPNPDERTALKDFIETDMAYGVFQAHEADILSGTGTTMVDGITNITGTQTQATTGEPLHDVRKALTKLQNLDVMPDALVVNPADAEALDLATDGMGNYHLGGPGSGRTASAWTIPIIVTTGLAAGQAILGDFAGGAVRWEGEGRIEWVRLNDDARYNKARLLAESGASAAIARPDHFVLIEI